MKNQTWDDYEAAANKGPFPIFWKVLGALLLIGSVLGAIGYGCGIIGETAQLAHDEFGPKAALAKYDWFKDAAAALDKKRADIGIYEARQKSMGDTYEGASRSKWAREDREQANVWLSEVAGVKASYNQLAGEYNAKMAEINWRFANRGDLPAGATDPLPREFKPYIDQ